MTNRISGISSGTTSLIVPLFVIVLVMLYSSYFSAAGIETPGLQYSAYEVRLSVTLSVVV